MPANTRARAAPPRSPGVLPLLRGKWVKIIGWGDAAEAHKLVLEGIQRAKAAEAEG